MASINPPQEDVCSSGSPSVGPNPSVPFDQGLSNASGQLVLYGRESGRSLTDLPPEVFNHIFQFWCFSESNLSVSRLISSRLNEALSYDYSQYTTFMSTNRVFQQVMGLRTEHLEARMPDDFEFDEEFASKGFDFQPLTKTGLDEHKKEFFYHKFKFRKFRQEQIRKADGLIERFYGDFEYGKVGVLRILQKFEPSNERLRKIETLLELQSNRYLEIKHEWETLACGRGYWYGYGYGGRNPIMSQFNAHVELQLAQLEANLSREGLIKILDVFYSIIKIGLSREITEGNLRKLMEMCAKNMHPKDALRVVTEYFVKARKDSRSVLLGRFGGLLWLLLEEFIKMGNCQAIVMCLNQPEFRLDSLPELLLPKLINWLLQKNEDITARWLLDHSRPWPEKAFLHLQIAIATKDLNELEKAKKLLSELDDIACQVMGERSKNFGERPFGLPLPLVEAYQHEQWKNLMAMKIVQAYLKLESVEEAIAFRDQLSPYARFQAQLEILKAYPGRDEIAFAIDLACSMNEKKDILLTQLITEYLKTDKTDDSQKLSRAIEALTRITDPYYQIKAQIQILKASNGAEYSSAKGHMDYLMGVEFRDLLTSREDGYYEYWIQLLNNRLELKEFKDYERGMPPRQSNEWSIELLRAEQKQASQETRIQAVQNGLMQELQNELMDVYIQKDIDSAINLATEMRDDIRSNGEKTKLNLIDELLKREKIQEAKQLMEQFKNAYYKVAAQIKIAKAVLGERWNEEFLYAEGLIEELGNDNANTSDYFLAALPGGGKASYTKMDVILDLVEACLEREDLQKEEKIQRLLNKVDPMEKIGNLQKIGKRVNLFLERKDFHSAQILIDLILEITMTYSIFQPYIPPRQDVVDAQIRLIEAMRRPVI